jgi:hypothetical protein
MLDEQYEDKIFAKMKPNEKLLAWDAQKNKARERMEPIFERYKNDIKT